MEAEDAEDDDDQKSSAKVPKLAINQNETPGGDDSAKKVDRLSKLQE